MNALAVTGEGAMDDCYRFAQTDGRQASRIGGPIQSIELAEGSSAIGNHIKLKNFRAILEKILIDRKIRKICAGNGNRIFGEAGINVNLFEWPC